MTVGWQLYSKYIKEDIVKEIKKYLPRYTLCRTEECTIYQSMKLLRLAF